MAVLPCVGHRPDSGPLTVRMRLLPRCITPGGRRICTCFQIIAGRDHPRSALPGYGVRLGYGRKNGPDRHPWRCQGQL